MVNYLFDCDSRTNYFDDIFTSKGHNDEEDFEEDTPPLNASFKQLELKQFMNGKVLV